MTSISPLSHGILPGGCIIPPAPHGLMAGDGGCVIPPAPHGIVQGDGGCIRHGQRDTSAPRDPRDFTGTTVTAGKTATEQAAIGYHNCWDPRTWGVQLPAPTSPIQ